MSVDKVRSQKSVFGNWTQAVVMHGSHVIYKAEFTLTEELALKKATPLGNGRDSGDKMLAAC